MNNIYTDQWGRFHHKECINGEPSGNNGFLFTAYAKKAGLPVNHFKLRACWKNCRLDQELPQDGYKFLRNPGKDTPPISRDEILGLVSLGFIEKYHLQKKGLDWNFSPYPLPKFSLTKLLSQLWELRPMVISLKDFLNPEDTSKFTKVLGRAVIFKHRNYFWQNNLDQIYRFAFSVPVQDRYFILKYWDKFQWYKPSHLFYAAISGLDKKFGKPSGIRWLKYATSAGEPLAPGDLELAQAMVEEFPEDHPIRKQLGL